MPECTVLVVDDDPTIRSAVAELLDAEGYRIRIASNGQDALEQIEQEAPTLVVLDMRMPILDGLAFARAAAATKRGTKMKILVMTAAVDASQAARAIEADGFLDKPFSFSDLLSEVNRLCRAAESTREVEPAEGTGFTSPRQPSR